MATAEKTTANQLDIVDVTGKKAGSVELPAELFDVQVNVPLIHQVVVAQLAAARQGTHKVKGRGEVSGAGRKPFKQKGTGRARQGSIRAPQMTGGGIVHGPTPRSYAQRTPKKMIAAALLGALSDRARGQRLHVVESLALGDAPSTKSVVELLETIATSKHVLIVLERGDDVSYKSVRNIPTVHTLTFDQLNAYDVLVSDDIVFTKPAFDGFVAGKSASTSSATDKEEVDA
jgi:large subunit ribosomal protein L4